MRSMHVKITILIKKASNTILRVVNLGPFFSGAGACSAIGACSSIGACCSAGVCGSAAGACGSSCLSIRTV